MEASHVFCCLDNRVCGGKDLSSLDATRFPPQSFSEGFGPRILPPVAGVAGGLVTSLMIVFSAECIPLLSKVCD
jgi:hypothetical protein